MKTTRAGTLLGRGARAPMRGAFARRAAANFGSPSTQRMGQPRAERRLAALSPTFAPTSRMVPPPGWLANATRVADRLYAIDRGEITFQGDPRQALEDQAVMSSVRG